MLSVPSENGFTLIELIVAGMVGLIAMGMFTAVFIEGLSRSNDAEVAGISAADAADALDRIEDDVRAARSPGRNEIEDISTRDDLKTRMNDQPKKYGDILVATQDTLTLWTHAQDPLTPTCVTYGLEQIVDSVKVWALVRRESQTSCPVPTTQAVEVLATLGETKPAGALLSYGLMQPVAGTQCSNQTISPAGPINDLNRLRIVNVAVDISALSQRRDRTRSADARTTVGLRARQNNDYYYAIGCAT